MAKVKLESFLQEICEKTTDNNQYPVLTSSKTGLYLQREYFNKQVASKDNTGYKIIKRGQFTYRAMSDTGEFFPNMLECTDVGIVSPAYPVFEISNRDMVEPKFLKFYFKSKGFQQSIASFVQGSTRTSVKYGKLKTVTIELLDMNQQRKIINILDKIQTIIDCRIEEIKKFDDLIKARFVEMFGKYMKGDTIPIKHIAEFTTVGIANSATHAYADSGVIMLRNQNIRINHLDDSDLIYIKPEFAKKYQGKCLKESDILITRTGVNVGMACVVPAKYEGCQTFTTLILRLIDPSLAGFVCYYINSPFGVAYIENTKVGGAQANFGAKALAEMPIIMPPTELQREFASFVAQVDKSKVVAQQMLEEAQQLFNSLMQEYFG